MPSFEYECLVLFPEPNTSNEEKNKGDTYGAGPLGIRFLEELGDFKGRKDSLEREDAKQTLKQVESVL
jgi:hypothetical protein